MLVTIENYSQLSNHLIADIIKTATNTILIDKRWDMKAWEESSWKVKCDALRHLVPFVQFKNMWKTPMEEC